VWRRTRRIGGSPFEPVETPSKGPTAEGGGTLALPIMIAIVAYIVLHTVIKGLLRLIANRRTEI
jgi:hypothetical protein